MNKLDALLQQLKKAPEAVEFSDVITVIDEYYHYSPTQFNNGTADDHIINDAGENEGSCKIFSFAEIQDLDKNQTLHCFGQYYRSDVLENPDEKNHANIRTFMNHGWAGIRFKNRALELKTK